MNSRKYAANLKYLSRSEIDDEKWNRCIDTSPNGLVYALSWYLDAVSPQWEAIVVLHGGEYQLCFPLPVRTKWGMRYLYHPHFCQQLGIYCRKSPDSAVTQEVFQALFSQYPYIPRLFLNVHNIWDIPNSNGLRIQHAFTHELPLNRPYTALHKKYRRDRRYRLKQAKRQQVSLVASEDIEPLVDIFLQDTIQKVPGAKADIIYDQVLNLFKAVKRYGRYELYYTRDTYGNYTSGAWFVIYNYRIVYLFNAALNTVRNENGRTLIIDHIIQKYQNSPYTLDFESPEKESICDFYASFGSKAALFLSLYFNSLPSFVKFLHCQKIVAHRKVLQWVYPHRSLPDITLPK